MRQLEPEAGETQQLREAVGLAGDLQQGRITMQQVVSRILDRNIGKQLLLVADQFEELYTLCSVKEEQEKFAEGLLTAITQENITLVLTLRADFIGYVLSYRPFKDALQNYTPQFLSSMKREELQQAIELPAQKLEVELETQLTHRILDDVGEEPGNLPLLEFALTRLWEKQINRELTHQAYEEIGGVKKAIANHAEQVYQKLSESQKKKAQRIFVQLIRPGEGTEDTRRIATREEVGEDNWNLVSYLAGYQARLVVTGRDKETGLDTVEVVHEALIREWGTFREWINASRDFRTWQERLKVALREWKNNNYDNGGLLRGGSLSTAKDWLQKHPDQLSIEERKFIDKSIKRQKRKDFINQFRVGSIAISLVVVSGLLIQTQHNSEINNMSTLSQNLLQSNREFEGLIEILKAAHKSKNILLTTSDSRNRVLTNLRQAVYAVRELNRLEKHQNWVTSVSFNKEGDILTSSSDKTLILWSKEGRLLQDFGKVHDDTIWKATFSPNGKMIASASKDKTVKVWSKENGKWNLKPLLLNHSSPVRVVKFSPNGQIIASVDEDSNIKFWSTDGKPLNSIPANQGMLLSMSFKDDNTLATGGYDSTVIFWRSKDGTFKDVEPLATLKGHGPKGVWSLDFSHNGKMLATGGRDGTIKLWRQQEENNSDDWIKDLNFSLDKKTLGEMCDNKLKKSKNGIEFSCLKASKDYVRGVSFSPDDQIIAGATWDKKVLLWDWDKPGTTHKTLKGHENGVWDVNFSFDGKIIASASADNTVKLWNKEENRQAFGGGDRIIWDISFSPDSQRIASASECRIVKQRAINGHSIMKDLVDPNLDQSPESRCDNRTQRSHNGQVQEVVYSPTDGQMIATAGWDCTVKLWDSEGSLKTTLIDDSLKSKDKNCSNKSSHSEEVQGVAFSPDGENIASASLDNTIKLWAKDGRLRTTFQGHRSEVNKVRFSPDGKTLVSASRDNTVILWNLKGDIKRILKGHNNSVRDVSFSPDGQIIASVSLDQTIKLWSKDGKLLKTLYGHSGAVESVSFSSDSQMIASGSTDHTVKIWSRDGILLNTIDVPEGPIYSVSFSPDDKFLAAGVDDGKLRLWNIELKTLKEKACDQVRDYLQHNPNSIELGNGHHCNQVEPSATAFFLRGEKLASEGEIEDAAAHFQQAVKRDPSLNIKPKEKAKKIAGLSFMEEGNSLAKDGEIEQAISQFEKALSFDPSLKIDPKTKANKIAASSFINNGKILARDGKIEEAVTQFEKALELDPSGLKIEPLAEARKLAASNLLKTGETLLESGKFDEALNTYIQAQEWDSDLKISASDWNKLCWEGSINQQAEKVIFACDQAVELEPNNRLIRNSRGLARALMGNYNDAIEDFEAFVEPTKNEEEKAKIKGWIESLKKNINPFKNEVLEKLRSE